MDKHLCRSCYFAAKKQHMDCFIKLYNINNKAISEDVCGYILNHDRPEFLLYIINNNLIQILKNAIHARHESNTIHYLKTIPEENLNILYAHGFIKQYIYDKVIDKSYNPIILK